MTPITGNANRAFDRAPGIAFSTHSRPGPNWLRIALYGVEFIGIAGVVGIVVSALWSGGQ